MHTHTGHVQRTRYLLYMSRELYIHLENCKKACVNISQTTSDYTMFIPAVWGNFCAEPNGLTGIFLFMVFKDTCEAGAHIHCKKEGQADVNHSSTGEEPMGNDLPVCGYV